MKPSHTASTDDEVMLEVWRIKDETAKRFKSVSEYVSALHAKAEPTKKSLNRTARKRADGSLNG